jgi:molybdate transport system substrate-binding protein
MATGCGGGKAPEATVDPEAMEAVVGTTGVEAQASEVSGEIMIAAAASLQNAIEGELIPMFNGIYPDIQVIGTYDSSGKLQTQIENGLGTQIFFSAAAKQMDALVEGGFIDPATVVNLLENDVVLITGSNTETTVTGFESITDAAIIAIGDPGSVPAGQYAEEILTALGIWEEADEKSSHGTNVTEVLKWVAEGSAEVGIVYMTDAASMADVVRVISSAPEGTLKKPVIYPVGLHTQLGDKEAAAKAFLSFLESPEALEVFNSYGFKTQ